MRRRPKHHVPVPARARRAALALVVPMMAGAVVANGPAEGAEGPTSPVAATVTVSGNGMDFSPTGGIVAGATVSVLELPGFTTTTGGDGSWTLASLPLGATATFVLEAAGRPTMQTATFNLTGDITQVAFQSPSQQLYDGLAEVLAVVPDPARCQIASTVTRRGHSLYSSPHPTHGEPFATVTLTPRNSGSGRVAADGPVYFNLVAYNLIWPDRSLTETTADGGVVFANVAPGEYTLHASKPGATIRPVDVTCRPGVLTNAAPPWGLQVLSGGLGVDEEAPMPVPTTSTATSTPTTAADTTATDNGTSTTGADPEARAPSTRAWVSTAPAFAG